MHPARNQSQLLKALYSPFATWPLASKLLRDRSRHDTEHILTGKIDGSFIQKIDQSVEMGNFISALQRPIRSGSGNPVEDFKYTLDTESYRAIFAKAKETATSSPSGIHYRHYIAAC